MTKPKTTYEQKLDAEVTKLMKDDLELVRAGKLSPTLESYFKSGAAFGAAYEAERSKGLVEAAKRLLERIDANGGIGEYNGGPAFVVEPLRELLALYEQGE